MTSISIDFRYQLILIGGLLSLIWIDFHIDFNRLTRSGQIREKPRYTVHRVPLTKNKLWAPFVARDNEVERIVQ